MINFTSQSEISNFLVFSKRESKLFRNFATQSYICFAFYGTPRASSPTVSLKTCRKANFTAFSDFTYRMINFTLHSKISLVFCRPLRYKTNNETSPKKLRLLRKKRVTRGKQRPPVRKFRTGGLTMLYNKLIYPDIFLF